MSIKRYASGSAADFTLFLILGHWIKNTTQYKRVERKRYLENYGNKNKGYTRKGRIDRKGYSSEIKELTRLNVIDP